MYLKVVSEHMMYGILYMYVFYFSNVNVNDRN